LTFLIVATWVEGFVADAFSAALRARLAKREAGGISLLWYMVVVPTVVAALVTGDAVMTKYMRSYPAAFAFRGTVHIPQSTLEIRKRFAVS
jgi:hypothetical protein